MDKVNLDYKTLLDDLIQELQNFKECDYSMFDYYKLSQALEHFQEINDKVDDVESLIEERLIFIENEWGRSFN